MNQLRLIQPYNKWRPDELLAYYQHRQHVHSFALRDGEQASAEKIAGVLYNRFDFHGDAYELPANFDWTHNPSRDKEWLILLHKFYYAVGLGEEFATTGDRRYFDKWQELTEHWIDSVALDFLPSDVTGRRVQNWIFAHHYFIAQSKTSLLTPTFYQKFLASLQQQVNYLCNHLTPARNHRTIELYAIFMAAVIFPEFQDAAEWLNFSRQELLNNIQNDILADGVHCEMSTDYHHLVVRNYLGILQLAQLNEIDMPDALRQRLRAALDFAKYVHKPDGMIPSLSDGDSRSFRDVLLQGYHTFGDEELRYVATAGAHGCAPQTRARLFAESGYAILRSGWGEAGDDFGDARYLIFDCGPLGAGNHGHIDLLNIEAAAYGQSLIVDPGRYTYHEPGPDSHETNWRRLFRGTSYHNTVTVDGKEQTRYEFRKNRVRITGPEPRYELKSFVSNDSRDYLQGIIHSHEYPVSHERRIIFVRPFYWVISDILTHTATEEETTAVDHRYDLRFHLSAGAWGKTHACLNASTRLVHAPHLLLAQPCEEEVELALEDGFVSTTYGIKQPAPIVRYTKHASNAVFHTVLYPYKCEPPTLSVTPIKVEQTQNKETQMLSLRVVIERRNQKWVDTLSSFDGGAQVTSRKVMID